MRVYRVENQDKKGPFWGGFTEGLSVGRRAMWLEHTNDLPTMREEVPEFYMCEHRDYISGVVSLEHLCRWFGPFFKDLERAGFFVSEYDLDSEWVVSGEMQVAFLSLAAKLVRSISWREIAPGRI
jgi:hypothetical protein